MSQKLQSSPEPLRTQEADRSDGQIPDLSALPLLPVMDRTSDGFCLATSDSWRVAHANPTLLSWLGTTLNEYRGRLAADSFLDLRNSDTKLQLEKVVRGDMEEAALWSELRTRHSSDMTVRLRVRRVMLANQVLLGIIAQKAGSDILASNQPAGRIDPLTGLPDRSFLLDRIGMLLDSSRSADHQFAVLFVDLDNFKRVNDTYGHLVGDRVLCEVVRRMSSCVRGGDHISRYGGDEFVVLVGRVNSLQEVQPVVDRIHASLEAPFSLPDGEVFLSVSVGVATAGDETCTAKALISAADRAMYASKRGDAS